MEERQEVLEALREELIERVDRYRVHKLRLDNPLDRDMEDQAIELENEDVIDALEEEAEEELRQVVHALERIEEGAGKECERCGEAIDPRRSRRFPTLRCVSIAPSSRGGVSRNRLKQDLPSVRVLV